MFIIYRFITFLPILFLIYGCTNDRIDYYPENDSLRFAGEYHLRNIKQLTFGGNNAEAYWSFDGRQLIFQSDWEKINPQGCDQIFLMNADGSPMENGNMYDLVSTGRGRTTCAYFMNDNIRVVYASTHGTDEECPESQMFINGKYVWPIYNSYNIYISNIDRSNLNALVSSDYYDAEATVSPDGKFMIFTSTRSGDLDLWRYNFEDGELLQLTDKLGYDGGAFFSHDSKKIVWRASRPVGEAAAQYKELLHQGLVEPTALNIFVSDIDGNNIQQVTNLPGANWAPFFHPSNEKVLFCSNHHSLEKGGRLFDIFMIDLDGKNMKQITHSGTFDAFPMFSPNGKKIVFASNRTSEGEPTRSTNVFVADWIEQPEKFDFEFQKQNVN